MKTQLLNRLYAVVVVALIGSASLVAQQRDVIELKNGSVIKGIITEQVPGVSYKIETGDGSVMVYSASDVEKITKEDSQLDTEQNETVSSNSNVRKGFGIGAGPVLMGGNSGIAAKVNYTFQKFRLEGWYAELYKAEGEAGFIEIDFKYLFPVSTNYNMYLTAGYLYHSGNVDFRALTWGCEAEFKLSKHLSLNFWIGDAITFDVVESFGENYNYFAYASYIMFTGGLFYRF